MAPTTWRREAVQLIVLAAPLVVAQLAQNGMNVVDTLMVGRLGARALAGIALGGTVFAFVQLLLMAVLLSVAPHVAQAHGARDPDRASRAARQGLWLAALLSVPGCAVLLAGRRLLLLTGQEADLAAVAGAYLRSMAPGLPFALSFTALRGFLEGHGDTRPIVVVAGLGVGLNVLANQGLMFGRWGLPRLGLVGCGTATSLVFAAMTITLAGLIAWRYPEHRVFRGLRTPDPATLGSLLSVGWPISLAMAFEVGLFALTTLLMGRFGEAALAGHQIAFQSASTTFMVPLGISIAAGIRVGQGAGANDGTRVRRAAAAALVLAVFVMACAGLVFWRLPDAVIGLYLDVRDPANAGVVAWARTFLGVAALFQIFDGVQVAASGALRGLKDTRVPMLLTLVAYWVVGAPVATLLAFAVGLGPHGLWFGLVVGLALSATLLAGRLARLTRPGALGRSAPPALR